MGYSSKESPSLVCPAGFAIPESYEGHLMGSLLSGLVRLPQANELPLIAVKHVNAFKVEFALTGHLLEGLDNISMDWRSEELQTLSPRPTL